MVSPDDLREKDESINSIPSINQFIINCLIDQYRSQPFKRSFSLTSLVSRPYPSHTLFPHSTNRLRQSILRTDYLIILAETFDDYRSPLTQSLPNQQLPSSSSSSSDPQPQHSDRFTVPIFAIEASLYRLTRNSVGLIYISKIDSTGLSPYPTPASLVTISFLRYFLNHPIRSVKSLRIHIFARAAREGQYLFPGSASNVLNGRGDGAPSDTLGKTCGKRILDDQQLIRWWFRVLSDLSNDQQLRDHLDCFYILPGFDQHEAEAILHNVSDLSVRWNYGHPYNSIGSPVLNTTAVGVEALRAQLSDLIPCFNDDPKARFIHSLGSCSTNPSGESGDWDDAILERDQTSMNQVGVDEFWIRMGARQECCDGRVSAFFVLAFRGFNNRLKRTSQKASEGCLTDQSGTASKVNSCGTKALRDEGCVSRNVWVSLWSKIHNKDYSKLDQFSNCYKSWVDDVKSCIKSELRTNPTFSSNSTSSSSLITNLTDTKTDDTESTKNDCNQRLEQIFSELEEEYHSEFVIEDSIEMSDEKRRLKDDGFKIEKKVNNVNTLIARKKAKK
ncbi:histone acetylation protein-domain-containing protein [Phakopsora pachyrhizi]|uniref:histone acetyltransferase n=1 Tax=Phakopsora pachyrhizi TaxID=170000 RepID=A0AAV0BD27_PHAPC|nr:histone acetylation protein-domain-containing protein [Phakopsora pachyrhizi]